VVGLIARVYRAANESQHKKIYKKDNPMAAAVHGQVINNY